MEEGLRRPWCSSFRYGSAVVFDFVLFLITLMVILIMIVFIVYNSILLIITI